MNIREILDKLTVLNKPLIEMNWQDIYDLNKDQIKNPNLIYPNQKFKMPGGGEYVVKAGDSLSKIAKQYVAKVDTAKKEPEKSDVDKQIEKDKTNPQNTPPKKDGQSGQATTTPVEKPPAITVPPVQITQNDFDPNRAVDAKRPSGFDWGKIRTQADTDYSTGTTGTDKTGSPVITSPFKRNSQAIPQTGGVFNQTGLGTIGLGKELDTTKPGWKMSDHDNAMLLWSAGLGPYPKEEKPKTAPVSTTTTTTPSTTTPSTTTPAPRPPPNTAIPPNLRN